MSVLKGIIIERQTPLDLEELAQAVHIRHEIIIEMVDNHLVEPAGKTPETWQFDDICFKRVKVAASFYRDLEINMQGIALALDLLEKIERLENRINILKKLESL